MAICDLCNEPIDLSDPSNYIEVTVWVHGPKADGATARQKTGKVAHEDCVLLLKSGQAPDQNKLF